MTGGNGDLSSPAPPRARTGLSSGSEKKRNTAVFHASSGRWLCCRCWKSFRSPHGVYGHSHVHKGPPKQQVEGSERKRKEAVSFASGESKSCSLSGTQFKSHQACCGHMRVDNNQPQRQVQQVHEEQDEELARNLLKLGQWTLNKMEGRETKGDSSAMAEDGASLSAAEARRKKIHMKLDLNKDAPEDDENDDEEGA